MGIQVVVEDMNGNELGAFESAAEAHRFTEENKLHYDNLFGKEQTCRKVYVKDSPEWDIAYKCWAESKIYPSLFDDDDAYAAKIKELNPYYGYHNSVRNMLCEYKNKYIVLLKEGKIDEDNAGDDPFITMYYAHNFDWISDFVRKFACRCFGEVAIYDVNEDGDVSRLFKEKTSNKTEFKVFEENRYELFEEMWDSIGWHPASVD